MGGGISCSFPSLCVLAWHTVCEADLSMSAEMWFKECVIMSVCYLMYKDDSKSRKIWKTIITRFKWVSEFSKMSGHTCPLCADVAIQCERLSQACVCQQGIVTDLTFTPVCHTHKAAGGVGSCLLPPRLWQLVRVTSAQARRCCTLHVHDLQSFVMWELWGYIDLNVWNQRFDPLFRL